MSRLLSFCQSHLAVFRAHSTMVPALIARQPWKISPSHGLATAAPTASPSHGLASCDCGSHHDLATADCSPRDSASFSRPGPSPGLTTADYPSRGSAIIIIVVAIRRAWPRQLASMYWQQAHSRGQFSKGHLGLANASLMRWCLRIPAPIWRLM